MKKARELPSQEYLSECFSYNPETGILTWKERPLSHFCSEKIGKSWNDRLANRMVGKKSKFGHLSVKINSGYYLIHRIVWKMMTGKDPENFIDHINRNASDNRFCNLREATASENQRNRGMDPRNKSGFKGVFWNRCRKKWGAQIGVDGRIIVIGFFCSLDEAKSAYIKAANELHGEFASYG